MNEGGSGRPLVLNEVCFHPADFRQVIVVVRLFIVIEGAGQADRLTDPPVTVRRSAALPVVLDHLVDDVLHHLPDQRRHEMHLRSFQRFSKPARAASPIEPVTARFTPVTQSTAGFSCKLVRFPWMTDASAPEIRCDLPFDFRSTAVANGLMQVPLRQDSRGQHSVRRSNSASHPAPRPGTRSPIPPKARPSGAFASSQSMRRFSSASPSTFPSA